MAVDWLEMDGMFHEQIISLTALDIIISSLMTRGGDLVPCVEGVHSGHCL